MAHIQTETRFSRGNCFWCGRIYIKFLKSLQFLYIQNLLSHKQIVWRKSKAFLTKILDPLAHISKGSLHIERTSFVPRPAVWPWPLTIWPENQWGSSTPRWHPRFQVWQLSGKGGQKTEQTLLGLQTDQPTDRCKTICPFFFKESGGVC